MDAKLNPAYVADFIAEKCRSFSFQKEEQVSDALPDKNLYRCRVDVNFPCPPTMEDVERVLAAAIAVLQANAGFYEVLGACENKLDHSKGTRVGEEWVCRRMVDNETNEFTDDIAIGLQRTLRYPPQ